MADDNEDEEDYMSDAVLQKVEAELKRSSADNSSASDYKKRRRQAAEQTLSSQQTPVREQIKETREAGLAKAISSDNKGFQLLQKMGYKQGETLGTRGTGLVEPIKVTIKQDRLGLGRAEIVREANEREQQQKKQEETQKQEKSEGKKDNFRQAMRSKYADQQIRSNINESRSVIQQLDQANNIEDNELWFTRNRPNAQKDADGHIIPSEFDELPITEQLQSVTDYLRRCYFFCVWCGLTYNSFDDIESQCPGDTAEAH